VNDDRISEIRAVLELSATQLVADWDNYAELYKWADNERTRRIRAILDRPAPAPRVFLPGDTVPKGVATVMPPLPSEDRDYPYVMHEAGWDYAVDANYPVVELVLPSVEEVRAAIERARTERADAEWQATDGVTP
jgi:DTW domain-containing protein YfiP